MQTTENEEKKVATGYRVTPERHQQLILLAAQRRQKMQHLIDEAVDAYLATGQDTGPPRSRAMQELFDEFVDFLTHPTREERHIARHLREHLEARKKKRED